MQEKKESKLNPTLLLTPYEMGNLVFKTSAISFAVSLSMQPFQSALNVIQTRSYNGVRAFALGSFRGIGTSIIAGQQRGMFIVSSKQIKQTENREFEKEIEADMELAGGDRHQQRKLGIWYTLSFAQADLLLTNAMGAKAKLVNAGVITNTNFKWSRHNVQALTMGTYPARTISGFTYFLGVGRGGDYVSSYYKFDREIYNKIAGGATSGVIATLIATIPNAFADRQLLLSKIENKRVLTESSFTLFRMAKSHVQSVGLKEATSHFIKFYCLEVAVRAPMTALAFSIIMGMDELLGPKPLDNVFYPKPKVSGNDRPSM